MLVRKLSNRFTKPEDEIIIEGAEPDNMYFLVNGEVEVFVTDKNLKKNSVCFLSPGAQFGELGLIYNIHRTASVISYGYCTIAELSKKNFQSLVLSFPMLKNKMIRAAEVYDDPWKRFLLDSLSQAEYFEALPRQVFREFPYRMEIMKLEKGGYLFKPGEIPKCIYLVALGELEISVTINEKHLHLLKAHEHFPNIENEPRIPRNQRTLEDYKDYSFDIFKADSLKKKAEIVPIMDQKGIVGSIRLDEEVPEKTSMIGDYPQEIILGNISQGALISSTFIYAKMPYLFQCKALNTVTVYALKLETIKELAKNHPAFENEMKEIKSEIKGKKYPNILDIIQPETSSERIKKLWVSAILRVIAQLRQERRGGVGLLLQITSKLKAIIACEEAGNFDLAEKVARGDIPPHYILEDGTLDPAAINSNINSSLPVNHPMMMTLKAMLDSITQPGGNIVRQYNALDKKILQHSKIIQSYGKSLEEVKDTLRKIINKLKGNIDEPEPEKIKDQLPKLGNVEEAKRKEMMKLDIQKVYTSEEERLQRREAKKLAKIQRKNDRASINEAVIKPRSQIDEVDRPKDLISSFKESKE
ncbi:unnamed protein product [Blepharisma stoltei]|uniref:Cyclic nucleotide-binding domain-containing protein n=1 Tax=Blepharisma stoltei TaxID=1481888 RepID=A0AAU9K6B3_9CILI|nr:unnamed protein product [Blepharisma stoltei]